MFQMTQHFPELNWTTWLGMVHFGHDLFRSRPIR